MPDKKTPRTLEEALRLSIPDPTESLINAFNERTTLLEQNIKELEAAYKKQLTELKISLNKTANTFSKITVAVNIVLGIGFVTLLFALVSTLMTSLQYNSDTYKSGLQSEVLDKLEKLEQKEREQLDGLLKTQ